jgi:hydroxyacylglutathione hydrolase
MRLHQFAIEGLGHLSTLIADAAAGVAVVVDPRRDVDVYLDAARGAGLAVTHVVETHLHNDYVSGGRELAALTGATHVIGAGAELRYEHHPMRDGEVFDVGSLRFRVLDTPGHTPEHVTYAVADTTRADEPVLLLTGGSLLVGAVGRTDLLGAANAVPFAGDMYRSLHDVILPHEDSVAIYPTHGAGSLCSTGISSTPWSTIGFERRTTRCFARWTSTRLRALLAGQPAFPRYFARMRPINQAGPRLLGESRHCRFRSRSRPFAMRSDGGALLIDAQPPGSMQRPTFRGPCRSRPERRSERGWVGSCLIQIDRSCCCSAPRRTGTTAFVRPCGSGSRVSLATFVADSAPGPRPASRPGRRLARGRSSPPG